MLKLDVTGRQEMYLLYVIYIAKFGFRVGSEKERQMLSEVIWLYYTLLLCCRNGRWNNVNIMMTFTDLK